MTPAHRDRDPDAKFTSVREKAAEVAKSPLGEVIRFVAAIVAIGSFIVAIGSFAAGVRLSVLGHYMHGIGWLLFAAAIIGLGIPLRHKSREVVELKKRLLLPLAKGGRDFHRFADIGKRKVVVKGVFYDPLLVYSAQHDQPLGIGIDLLNELLGRDVWKPTMPEPRCTWEGISQVFRDGRCHMIATPIFETNERSRTVAFSSPVFYADIGIYVDPNNRELNLDNGGPRKFEDALDLLTSSGDALQTQVIRGEMSEKLVDKLIKPKPTQIQRLDPSSTSLTDLIAMLAHGRGGVDYVFAERLIADETLPVKNRTVVNILLPGELTYPVGFAIRPEEYVLRHYINLKLLELDERHKDGMLGFLVAAFNRVRAHRAEPLDLETGAQYFVRSTQFAGPSGPDSRRDATVLPLEPRRTA